jgi:hypothetical protein
MSSLYPGRWRALLVSLCSPTCWCESPGKVPHETEWQRHALARFDDYHEREAEQHAARVREHVRRGGNVGLALPPYAAALDVDTDLNGGTDYSSLLARDAILAVCDEQPVQESGKTDTDGRRVGVHVLGASCDRRPYGTHFGSVPVTIRGVGNQIVVAPSRHRTGLEYQWIRELPADPALLPPFDATWFRHRATTRAKPIVRQRDEDETSWRQRVSEEWRADLEDADARFEPGRRHEALLWAGWHALRRGSADTEALEILREIAATRCAREGRFAAAPGTAERRALDRELFGIVRSCRRRLAAWPA